MGQRVTTPQLTPRFHQESCRRRYRSSGVAAFRYERAHPASPPPADLTPTLSFADPCFKEMSRVLSSSLPRPLLEPDPRQTYLWASRLGWGRWPTAEQRIRPGTRRAPLPRLNHRCAGNTALVSSGLRFFSPRVGVWEWNEVSPR